MKTKPRIYICGPLFSSGRVDANLIKAEMAATKLRRYGLNPFVPHRSFFANLIQFREEEFWMEWNLDELKLCQGLYRLPGPLSPNIASETTLASTLQIPIFTSLPKLLRYFGCEDREEDVY